MDIFDFLFGLMMLGLFALVTVCSYILGGLVAVTCGAPPELFGSVAAIVAGIYLVWDRATA